MGNMTERLKCLIVDCEMPSRNLHKPAYCKAHARRALKHGDPQAHLPLRLKSKTGVCEVPECEYKVQARGLCATHDWRLKNWGTLDTAGRRLKFRAEIGDRRVDGDGYVKVRMPDHPEAHLNGWAYEHRMVMSDFLKRPLVRGVENVHHINGIRHDNRIENLELWNTSQPSGQRPEDKVRYALEILRLYRPEALV